MKMTKWFVKKDKMITGELVIKKESYNQLIADLLYVNALLGNGIYETQQLADRIWKNSSAAIRVPVTTTEKVWKQIKTSGVKLVATTVKGVAC